MQHKLPTSTRWADFGLRPRVSCTGGSALSDLHRNARRSSCTNMPPASVAKLAGARVRARRTDGLDAATPLPLWIITAALQRTRCHRPGPLRAEPARSSSAVACSRNRYSCRCFCSSLVGLLPPTPLGCTADVSTPRGTHLRQVE